MLADQVAVIMWSVQTVSAPGRASSAAVGTGRGCVVRVVMREEASRPARGVLSAGSVASLWERACEVRSTSEVDADCAGVRGETVPGAMVRAAEEIVGIRFWWVAPRLISVDKPVVLQAAQTVGELVSVKLVGFMEEENNKR